MVSVEGSSTADLLDQFGTPTSDELLKLINARVMYQTEHAGLVELSDTSMLNIEAALADEIDGIERYAVDVTVSQVVSEEDEGEGGAVATLGDTTEDTTREFENVAGIFLGEAVMEVVDSRFMYQSEVAYLQREQSARENVFNNTTQMYVVFGEAVPWIDDTVGAWIQLSNLAIDNNGVFHAEFEFVSSNWNNETVGVTRNLEKTFENAVHVVSNDHIISSDSRLAALPHHPTMPLGDTEHVNATSESMAAHIEVFEATTTGVEDVTDEEGIWTNVK